MKDHTNGYEDTEITNTEVPQPHASSSALFLVRIWRRDVPHGEVVWSGRLIHVASGKAHNFLELAGLNLLLTEMLGQSSDEVTTKPADTPANDSAF